VSERPLILGSGSPRRARILEELGLDFVVDAPGLVEPRVEGEGPEEHVLRLSSLKALAVAGRHESGTVIGADTTVILDGALLGKPADALHARKMLTALRGRWHEVVSGVTATRVSDGAVASGVERTNVLIRDLSDAEIEQYVRGGEPLDKAGAYGIQGCGATVVEKVNGCFYNVVGLPVVRLREVLARVARAGEPGHGA
jgi:septum formation protein